jgi:uncharacterized protein YjdB
MKTINKKLVLGTMFLILLVSFGAFSCKAAGAGGNGAAGPVSGGTGVKWDNLTSEPLPDSERNFVLTLSFSEIAGLSANSFTFEPEVVKGDFRQTDGSGIYEMDVSAVPLVSSIKVSVAKSGISISPSARLWNVDEGTSAPSPDGPAAVSGIALNEHTRAIEPGNEFQLTATVYPLYAANKNVTWDSNDIAVATVQADGLVSAITEGEATITATSEDGAFIDGCVVTVMPGVVQVTSVTITPHNDTLTDADDPYQLQADVLPANATDKTVTWQSSDNTVAEVSVSGLVTPKTIGSATITASAGGRSDTCVITVISGDAETPNITGQPQNRNYATNAEAVPLTVTASVNVGNLSYQWYSNDAPVNSSGDSLGNVSGAQTKSYTPPTGTTGTVHYYCVVTNTDNNAPGATTATTTSNTAAVTVATEVNAAAPTINTPPQPATYAKNAVATALTVGATGDGGILSYQWYSNSADSNTGGNLLVGADTDSYIPPTATFGTVYYYCVVTNTNNGVSGAIKTAETTSATACIIVINDATLAALAVGPYGVLTETFAPEITTTYNVTVPASAGTVTFAATPTNAQALSVEYAVGAGNFSNAEPVLTLSGLTGTITFSVKVTTPTMDYIWGPYTFNVTRPQYTVSGGLVYTTFDGTDYEGIIFTEGTGTVDLASPVVDFLLVAGGGGGGQSTQNNQSAGGGGAGGVIMPTGTDLPSGSYAIGVGEGGTGGNAMPYSSYGTTANAQKKAYIEANFNGKDSSIIGGSVSLIAKGGGGGGWLKSGNASPGGDGGSGGGGYGGVWGSAGLGTGTQGNSGGSTHQNAIANGGGGGYSSAGGAIPTSTTATTANGGAGIDAASISVLAGVSGVPSGFAGGGANGGASSTATHGGGQGGPGATNTGGGGAGGYNGNGRDGGSGIVVIKWAK